MDEIQVTHAVFIRKYCELLSRDYWEVESYHQTEPEALQAMLGYIQAGGTCKIDKVYNQKGRNPNL
jgi:hypothetical protein